MMSLKRQIEKEGEWGRGEEEPREPGFSTLFNHHIPINIILIQMFSIMLTLIGKI